MAITARVNLAGSVCVDNGCTELNFSDTTGSLVSACMAEQNNLGYGLTGGIALTDVTSAALNLYFPSLTTPIKYTFTILNGVITACTLTDLKGVVKNILSNLPSIVFPLFNFNMVANYGVKIPTASDGLYSWDYTISGLSASVPFNYTTSGGFLSDCNTQCCTSKSYLDLTTSCECSDAKMLEIIKQEVFLNGASYAINIGMDNKAYSFLTKAKEICDNKCKNC